MNLNQSKKTEMSGMFIEAVSLITTLLYLKTSQTDHTASYNNTRQLHSYSVVDERGGFLK